MIYDESYSKFIYSNLPHRTNSEIDRGPQFVESWCKRYGVWDHPITRRRFIEADPARIVSYSYPDAHGPDLDLAFSMMNIYLAVDDAFESVYWNNAYSEGARFIRSMVDVVVSSAEDYAHSPPLVRAFADVWRESRAGMSESWRARAAQTWCRYLWGYVMESIVQSRGLTITPDEYLLKRRWIIGTAPCFDMLERAHGYELPEVVASLEFIDEFRYLGADIIILCNDVASVPKDLHRGDTSNIVLLLSALGSSIEQSLTEVGDMIERKLQRYLSKRDELSDVLAALDLDEAEVSVVFRYVNEILEWCGANLDWQGQILRYYGKANALLADSGHMSGLTTAPGDA
ncbi:terpene synthase family protein [Nocardia brevicatena]|uniref:terpene synthase family protein n=1 Tax=Nocardia brevicatena TaxID=37327 RepID=UPI0012F8B98E|nr:terpene synthase family protein [Nocardia brevicatena]